MALPGKVCFPLAATAIAVLCAGGCIDIVGADFQKYVEREEKRFTATGKPDVTLSTFDGTIEVRSWDRPDVQVIVEKRGTTKEAVETIDVQTEQNGDHIVVNAVVPRKNGFGIHVRFNRSARLIVTMPAVSDLSAKSGDGSIDVDGITGRVTLRSGDGTIHGSRLGGELDAHTGDGSMRFDGVNGALNVNTGDGSIVASGKFTSVRARSGDGSINISADSGSAAAAEWNITTGDGTVTLTLPQEFNADLDAHTGDGGIRMQNFELSGVTGRLGRDTLRGRIGSGGATLRVRTGDGSILLKRALSAEATSPTEPR